FGIRKPFGVFALMLQQFLDMRKHRDELESRTAALQPLLEGAGRCEPDAYLLNPLLHTKLPLPAQRIEDPGIIEDMQLALMFHLYQKMFEAGPRVCIIDDAHFLDPQSWRLALAIATRSLGPYSDLSTAN